MQGSKEEIGYVGRLNFLLVKKCVVEHDLLVGLEFEDVAVVGLCGSYTDFEMLLHMIVPLFTCDRISNCQG